MFKVKQASKVKKKALVIRKINLQRIIFHNKARDTKCTSTMPFAARSNTHRVTVSLLSLLLYL